MKPELLDHTPVGTIGGCSDSGWIETSLFLTWIKHFGKYSNASKNNQVLLILDGHKTHTKNIELIEFARENGITVLSLPPHTSHKLQPLDRTFFKPLKTAFNNSCMSWMRRHPARRIVVDVLGELFSEAYIKAATLQNAVSGFRCTGIVPFNSEILPIYQFLNDPRNTVPDLPMSSSPNFDFVESENFENDDVPTQSASSDTPGTSGYQKTLSTPRSLNYGNADVPTQSASSDNPGTSGYQKTLSTPRSLNYGNADVPLISASSDPPEQDSHQISFSDIIPVPNIVEKVKTKRSEESQIITGTPYKEKLLESSEKRGKKQATCPK